MKTRTGVLPKDCKHLSRSKMDSEDIKELLWTILAAAVMVVSVSFCFLAASAAPEPEARDAVTLKGGHGHAGSYPVAARRQSNP